MADYSTELEFARDLAQLGGRIALGHFGRAPRSKLKDDGTWVTEADQAVESEIRNIIAEAHPSHNVLGEEQGLASAGGEAPDPEAPTWIIDPIDGTNNFMRGIPIWATLVALRSEDSSVLGVCEAAALGETYEAAEGRGARLNGSPIAVDPVEDLSQAGIAYSGTNAFYTAGLDGLLRELSLRAFRTRGFGDFWGHMLVARGALHVMLEPKLNLWDFAALEPIVREAGGNITRLDGGELSDGSSCLTTNRALHSQIIELAEQTSERTRA
jgi:histidinol-phosphatase